MSPARRPALRWKKRIEVRAGVLGGKPVIKGTRISVELVLDLLAAGWTADDIVSEYDHVTREDVRACLAYAAEALRDETVVPVRG